MGLIRKALLRALLWWGVLGAGIALSMGGTVAHFNTAAPSLPSRMVQAHGCWSGKAPADMEGKVPGHAVVARGSSGPRYVGAKLTGAALDQQFAHVPHGLTIYGFCR